MKPIGHYDMLTVGGARVCVCVCVCRTKGPKSSATSCVRFVFVFIWSAFSMHASHLINLTLNLCDMQIPIIVFDSCNPLRNPISCKLAFTSLRFSNLAHNSKITRILK